MLDLSVFGISYIRMKWFSKKKKKKSYKNESFGSVLGNYKMTSVKNNLIGLVVFLVL